jgi:hypothetical protein
MTFATCFIQKMLEQVIMLGTYKMSHKEPNCIPRSSIFSLYRVWLFLR